MKTQELKNYLIDFAKGNPLTGELNQIRENSLALLSDDILPHRRFESWKYTNINKEISKDFKRTEAHREKYIKNTDYITLFFDNGIFQKEESDAHSFDIIPINIYDEDYICKTINQDHKYKDDIITKLSKASLHKGYVFDFEKKTNLPKPILIDHYYSNDSFSNIVNIFKVEALSQVDILETISGAKNSFITSQVFMDISDSAIISHAIVQNLDQTGTYLSNQICNLAKDSFYGSCQINTGAKKSRNNIYSKLNAKNANVAIHGLYALKGDQHHDTNSYTKHAIEHTYSHQLYKGILNEESKGVFAGVVRIDKDAQLVNATQLNKNLILSNKAHAHSLPQMEIYADDVKCAHGSTTGQLSDDELFYFESRGIRKDKARQMLANAFATDVVLKIKSKLMQETIKKHLAATEVVNL